MSQTHKFIILAGSRGQADEFCRRNALSRHLAIVVCSDADSDRLHGLRGLAVHRTGTWWTNIHAATEALAERAATPPE